MSGMLFENYIETLTGTRLTDVCYRIYSEDIEYFKDYFPTVPADELVHVIYEEIDRLPFVLQEKILGQIDIIFKLELYKPSSKAEIILNNIIRLSNLYKRDIQLSLLLEAIDIDWIQNKLKLRLAIYLSNKEEIPHGVFEKMTIKNPYMLPALFNRLKYSNPFAALYFLNRFSNQADKVILRPMIRSLLINLLSIEMFSFKNYEKFSNYLKTVEDSCAEMIEEVLDNSQLQGIKTKLETFRLSYNNPVSTTTFNPDEFKAATSYLLSLSQNDSFDSNDNFYYQNLELLVFAFLCLLDEVNVTTSVGVSNMILDLDRTYHADFHLVLKKFGASFDTIDKEISYNDYSYLLHVTDEIQINTLRQLQVAQQNSRIAILSHIGTEHFSENI